MFLTGIVPVLVSIGVLLRVEESKKWEKTGGTARRTAPPLASILRGTYAKRTLVAAALLTVAIIGLWAGAVYEPSAVIQLARKAGMTAIEAGKMASVATGILSIGTILGCLALPPLAERFGRRKTLALYFAGMAASIAASFGWAFYLTNGLVPFISIL